MPRSLSYLRFALIVILFVYPIQTVHALAIPAEINKQFTPILIDAGGISVLRVTIFNPNLFQLTSASWNDNLVGIQPGLKIANPASVVSTCGAGVTAVPGTTTFSLSAGTVPAQVGSTPGECYVEVNVTSTVSGNLINTILENNLSASGNDNGTVVSITNTTPASATITVIAVTPPSITKGFSPNTVWVGQTSTLTITVNNNDTNTDLTQTSYTDTLPTNVVLANPVSPNLTNCGAGASLAAVSGTSTVGLSNATVTPNLNCVVTVQVKSGVAGSYTNTIPAGPAGPGSIVTQQGVTNAALASAPLNVQPVGITKIFSSANVVAGGTSTLTITLQNPTGSDYTGANITDILPAGLTISGTPSSPQCGGTITNTSTSVTLTGGTIPASASPPSPLGTCTIVVTVAAPADSPTATRTNTISAGALTTTQLVTNPAPATFALNVQSGITVLKSFSPPSITVGGISTVTIILRNHTGSNFTGVTLTDSLPANLTVFETPASPQCSGTITNTATSVSITGGTIPFSATPPGACTITFQVTSSVAATYSNTIPANDLTTAEGPKNTTTTTTSPNLIVNPAGGPVLVSKAFNTSPIAPGATSRLRITLTAPSDIGVSGINISDTLPGDLVIAASPIPVTTCGGTLTATIGTQLIKLIGGAIASASGTCTITVYVTTNTQGFYPNNIPANNVTTTQGRTNTSASNTPVLEVTGFTMSKAFNPPMVNANGLSTLTITLQNTGDSPLINVSLLSDTLPGSLVNGVVVAPFPNKSTTCTAGSVTADTGTQTISMSGAIVPAQVGGVPGICTINVDVQGTGSAGAHVNTIARANVSGTVQDTGTVIHPFAQAQSTLTVGDLTITVVKGFNPVFVYGKGSSTLSVQLVNPNNTQLTGVTFTDDLNYVPPAGVQSGMRLANPPNFNVGTCGGALSGNPGASSFLFSGGVIPANSNCTLTLSIVMDVNGNLTNTIPAGAVTTFNGAGSTQAAQASLTDLPGASVSKSFSPNPVLVGESSLLTITITNSSNIPLAGMELNDTLPVLPTGLMIADYLTFPAEFPVPVNNCGGALTADPNTQLIHLSGGALAAAISTPPPASVDPLNSSTWIPSSCTIVVSVISSVTGVFTNTIPPGGLTATGGVSNNLPATDTLVVLSSLYSLGNRVWFDTDNSGTINGTEIGINGVDVQLYAADGGGSPTGPLLATKTTANGGYYRFDDLAAGDYVVVIPSSEFGAGGTLDGYWSSAASLSGGGITETAAPDPNTDIDNDDNGTLHTAVDAFTGAVISSAVTLGGTPPEPITDTNADPTNPAGEAVNNRSNRTVDFGFYRQAVSNQIYVDANNDGTYNAGDVALAGARVQLFAGNGTTEINVGPDGIFGTSDDAANGVLTAAGGTYLFSGLPQGDYIVKVTPPTGYSSAVDTFNSGDTATPNNNINNNDNGIGTGTGQVSSNLVTLTPGSLGAATNNVVSNISGTTTNPTLDFGFTIPLFSLGNRVWFDADNSSTINGLESGINFVTVRLYAADGSGNPTGAILATKTTSNGGYYRFDNLLAGDYVVMIPALEFGPGGALDGYWSSATTLSGAGTTETAAPDADNDIDNDDNGTLHGAIDTFTGAVISSAITLGPGAVEPTTDTNADPTNPSGEAIDAQSNRTVDFGFYRSQLGNQIYTDVNNNGTYDAGDTALSTANVRLYGSDGTTEINVGPDGIFGTADDAAGGVTTGLAGTYLFSGLPQGTYIVKVTPPLGYTSAVDSADATDTSTPNTNIDDNDNGIGIGTGQVSSNTITLTPGSLGAATNNTVTNSTGTTFDPTLDFGFNAPLFSLGNRVWFDTDNSATINGTEVGVDLVAVELYRADISGNPTGAVLDTQTTANGGYYRFDNLSGGDYVIVIPSSEFSVGGKLFGYLSSGTTVSAAGVVSETVVAPDPDNNLDSDDNGILQTSGGFNGAVISLAVTLGPTPNEPTTDTDADPTNPPGEEANNQSNRTLDFGFYRQILSNQIFIDANNNGTYDTGDGKLAAATVRLFASNGSTEINVGPDGIYGTADDAAGGVTTGLNGTYLFSSLPQGNYIVKVTSFGFTSAIDTANSGDSTTPNNNIDNNDNGIGTGIGQVASNVLPLTPGSLGAASNNSVDNAAGTTSNPTLDFGFTPLFSLGNRIWFDTNNSGTINGSEVGANGIGVQLYAADGSGSPTGAVLSTQITANGGYYRFDNLSAGNYVVVIPSTIFGAGGALDGYWSSRTVLSGAGTSETAALDPDNDVDSDDNGTLQTSGTFTGAVISKAVTLGPLPNEPLGDSDSDPTSPSGEAPNLQSNRTVDFGFYRVELSNQVFVDVVDGGSYGVGDFPLSGATVQLFASDGTTEINVGPDGILGTTDDVSGGMTTGASGVYLFSGLPQGTFIVRVILLSGYASTVDSAVPGDTANPNLNADNNDNGIGTGTGQVYSKAVTLTPGDAATNNLVTNSTGTTTNPTLDFGFTSSFTKALISSDAAHTVDPHVAIGEIATYQINMYIPVGTLNNVILVDTPQTGLAFVDCINISIPQNVASSKIVNGTCDTRDGTSAGTSNPLIENSGGRVTFDFGNVTNSSAAPLAITIQYSLIVLDISSNQNGGTLTNNVVWSWTGGTKTTSAPLVDMIEPEITIDKNAEPSMAPLGAPITFKIDISHSNLSSADAFDVVVTDVLPSALTFITGSEKFTRTSGTLLQAPVISYNVAATTLSFIWDEFPLGQSAQLEFQAIFIGPSPAKNTASVEWTSLEIDPLTPGVPPRQRSPYHVDSTERWYDPLASAGLDDYRVSDSISIEVPSDLPKTGFAPGVVTTLPQRPQHFSYAQTDLMIEIPRLGIKLNIVGAPFGKDNWDLTWLSNNAGWLEGSAFPTHSGNSAITAHSYLSDGTAGPFAKLNTLRYGDQIIVTLAGSKYIYEVRQNLRVKPNTTSVLKHEDHSWITLITCQTYSEQLGEYIYRIVVRAVLIKVELEK